MGKLGDTLRERRLHLGLSVEQVESETRIRARLISAIEDGDYDRLPNPGYVRGYISSYARFLELDPVPLLNMYKAETGAGHTHLINLPQAEEAVKPTGQQHAVPWRTGVAIALVVGVVTLVVWLGGRMISGPKDSVAPDPATVATETTEPPVTQLETVTTATAPTKKPTKKPAATQTTEQTPTADASSSKSAPFSLRIRVASDSASWIRATIDGSRAYEGVLTGGQSKQYEVSQTAKVLVGKPESVKVYKDGKLVPIKDTGNLGTVTLKASEND